MLPQRGDLVQGDWKGAGYIAAKVDLFSASSVAYKISSNLKGGYPTFPIDPVFVVPAVEETTLYITPPPQVVSWDPIDLGSGAFLYDHTDLSVGSSDFPYGLTFSRSYNSNNRYSVGSLGAGWSHNFDIKAIINSDGLRGLGQDSPIAGAAAIAAAYVAQDLFDDLDKPLNKLVVATLVQRWFMDQLINNTVNVQIGAQSEQFVRLADNTYEPQPGSTNRLALNGGRYQLLQKDGTALNFNTQGNIAEWVNPSGVNVTFSYNAETHPKLVSVQNQVGRKLTLTYDGSNKLSAVSDETGRSVSYTFDSPGNLSAFTDPLGNSTTYTYDPSVSGLLTQIFNPSFPSVPSVTNTYDTLGRVSAQTNANGATWNYFFAGYRSEENDPYGTQHVLYYTPRGKVLFDIQDFAGLNLITANVYDGRDRFVSITQPEGNSVAFTYDNATNLWANNVTSIARNPKPSSPLSSTTQTFTYDSIWNKVATTTDALGSVSTFTYDAYGRLIRTISDAGLSPHINATKSFSYNELGKIASSTDSVGTVTRFEYDTFANLIATTADYGAGRLNRTTSYGYDVVGNAVSVTNPSGAVATSTYDAARRLLTVTAPAPFNFGSTLVRTINSYDPDGRQTSLTRTNASANQTTSTAYSPTGKILSVTDPNGSFVTRTYDLNDRVQSVSQPVAAWFDRVTRYNYDPLGRIVSVIDNAGNTAQQLTYTANGKPATFKDANNNTTSFAYDGFDRRSSTIYPMGSSEVATYDANDNVLTSRSRANQTTSYTYDALNRRATKAPPFPAAIVTYSYDPAGRLTGASDNSAPIASVAPPTGNSVRYETSLSYDILNRVVGVSWSPAPAAASPPSGSVTFSHIYNKANQRIGQSVTDNSWFNYPAATPGTVNYTSNALNQYTSAGSATPTYDGNGNLTGDGTFSFGYDAENRLVSGSASGTTASYSFDAQGRRKSKTVNGVTTLFVTDADNREVLEVDGSSGAIQRWYAYGLGSNEVLNRAEVVAAIRSAYVPDIQGSSVATIDSDSGSISKVGYLPYGANNGTASSFAFTGQRIDPELGSLYYYRARHYSPALGRFLQTDPVGYQGGSNLYAYVNNDPLNLIDPLGLTPVYQAAAQAPGFVLPGLITSGDILAGAGRFLGGLASASVATVGALSGVMLLATTTSTADRTRDEVQYVVRAGAGAASSFERGTALTINGYGFSAQTSPNVPVDELARGGYFPNRQISVSTVQELQAIPGVSVNFPTPGRGDYHGTVNVPNPPPVGLFDVISGVFRPQPNPFPTQR
jgi:RHS repeat-associated protein